MIAVLSLCFAFFSHLSHVQIYMPELVNDDCALMYADEYYEVILSVGNDDWYTFVFLGKKSDEFVNGKIVGLNTHGNPESDMLEKPIPYWYEYLPSGKAIGFIDFRGRERKIRFAPIGKSFPQMVE